MSLFHFRSGQSPLLISFPHSGTWVPEDILYRMTDAGRALPDTDWDLPRLYDIPEVQQASVLVSNVSRYAIDLNRPPDGSNLYPGQPTPELCPTMTFVGQPIYQPQCQPNSEEVARRLEQYWTPYHQRLLDERERLRQQFGKVVVFDAHSIAPQVPRLFTGTLPDLNVGTARGTSCGPALRQAIEHWLTSVTEYSHVVDGRFVGGYITRRYGEPAHDLHSIQLELSQSTYMRCGDGVSAKEAVRGDRAQFDEEKAARLQPVMRQLLQTILEFVSR